MQVQQNNNQVKTFNQLNIAKDISNFFIPKNNINKKFTDDSYQIRIFEKYISIPKKFCFLDKNKKNYLIGIKPNYIYNCYDAQKNWKEKISGNDLIKKYNLKGLHFLTVENQRFKNMQQSNPFLMQFKNAQESMEWHKKQVAKEKEQFKNYLLSLQKNKDNKVSENDLVNSNNISNSYQTTNYQQRQLDIKKITEELDKPIFS